MQVSGTTILTRKTLVTRKFGSDAWQGFFRDMALSHPCFRRPITAQSRIPLEDFLAFHDELVGRFYPNGRDDLFVLGAESARWALIDGPLKDFVRDPGIDTVVESFPRLWQRYFAETESRSEARLVEAGVEFRVHNLPAWHPYFEHFVIGYMREMLEIYCANSIWTRRLSQGIGRDYSYLLAMDPVHVPPPASTSLPLARARELTLRELEVLRLVGSGKTNREIAAILCISQKTVQHHVAHAYQKVGLCSRAGAALWLAERGLVR